MNPSKPVRWALALSSLPLPACALEVSGISESSSPAEAGDMLDASATGDDVPRLHHDASPPTEAGDPARDALHDAADATEGVSDAALDGSLASPPDDAHVVVDAAALQPAMPPASCTPDLALTVRDFAEHPDFPKRVLSPSGLLAAQLGADGTPVRAPVRTLLPTGMLAFEQWYHDTPGINVPLSVVLPLAHTPDGHVFYESSAFFPIDGRGFGDGPASFLRFGYAAVPAHNYLFTTEAHLRVRYRGGETLSFGTDDDAWLFVNGQLALDLGASARPVSATVSLDALARPLKLEPGEVYSLDIFHAARSTSASTYRLDTTLELVCGDPPS